MLFDVFIQAYPYLFAGTTLVALILPLILTMRDARLRRQRRLALASWRPQPIPLGAQHPRFAQPLPYQRPARYAPQPQRHAA